MLTQLCLGFLFEYMTQNYGAYTREDHEVWSTLFTRQLSNLDGIVARAYLHSIDELYPAFRNDAVPDFNEVNKVLLAKNGWTIEVVPGLIPVERFFELLANKHWCSSTWLRTKAQLDYIEEPDMFHDAFGHLPLIMDTTYAAFMERFGQLGVKHGDNPSALTALQRLYWFTIEFGLIRKDNETNIYGAGIISSSGETAHILNDAIEIKSFDLDQVIHTHFENDVIQNLYFQIDDFEQLYQSLDTLEQRIDEGLDVQASIVR